MNRDIQKVLKEKRKARNCAETKFGKYVKIEVDRDSEGMAKRCVLKIRPQYTPDSYMTVIASGPFSFNEELKNLTDAIGEAFLYMQGAVWEED